MERTDLKAFLRQEGMSQAELARQFDLSPNRVTRMLDGRAKIPRSIALACAAFSAGLSPWQPATQPKGK